jgi:hypothetical protein
MTTTVSDFLIERLSQCYYFRHRHAWVECS